MYGHKHEHILVYNPNGEEHEAYLREKIINKDGVDVVIISDDEQAFRILDSKSADLVLICNFMPCELLEEGFYQESMMRDPKVRGWRTMDFLETIREKRYNIDTYYLCPNTNWDITEKWNRPEERIAAGMNTLTGIEEHFQRLNNQIELIKTLYKIIDIL